MNLTISKIRERVKMPKWDQKGYLEPKCIISAGFLNEISTLEFVQNDF